jgi:hypothetical protein
VVREFDPSLCPASNEALLVADWLLALQLLLGSEGEMT